MILSNYIDARCTMYPAQAWMLGPGESFILPQTCDHSSTYGYSFGRSQLRVDGVIYTILPQHYFSFPVTSEFTVQSVDDGPLFLISKLGYRAQTVIGRIEERGRLTYIDGCSDSLLVYPPRLGDPSLNLLYFPPGIDQTFHVHPSIRLGCIARGQGIADLKNTEHMLKTGDMFCLGEQELHRFKTRDQSMTVIAWHPDGDWGPTDHDHTMLNRTYINK